MKKWEEKEMERQEAYAEGREEGERVGEARMNKLIVYLLEQGRNKDLAKAASDLRIRQELSELKSGTLHRFSNAEWFFLPQVNGQPAAYLKASFPSVALSASQQRNQDIYAWPLTGALRS